MKLWITGENRGGPDDAIVWDFIGVFDSEDKALAACHNEHCFVGPQVLNVDLGPERQVWVGCYYPKIEPEPAREETEQ